MKIPLGLWEGSTENAAGATALLSDLVDRGLDVEQGVLCVRDGAKALRKAVRAVLGVHTPVQRCIRHKERNVLDHLPERDRPHVKRRLRQAWADTNHNRALDALRALADELDRSHPGAAGSLREGLEETLTLARLGIRGTLKATLESTNPCESMIECVHRSARNVKRWQKRRHDAARDRRRDARSRAPVPAHHRLPRPRQARRRDRARTRPPHRPNPGPSGGRYARHRIDITRDRRTTNGTTSPWTRQPAEERQKRMGSVTRRASYRGKRRPSAFRGSRLILRAIEAARTDSLSAAL